MATCKHGAAGECPDCKSEDKRVLTGDELGGEFGINECPPAPRVPTPQEVMRQALIPQRPTRLITVYQPMPQEKLPEPGETKVYEMTTRIRGRLKYLTFLSDLDGLYLSSFSVGHVSPIDWSCCDKLPVDSWFLRGNTMQFDIPVLPSTVVRIGVYRRVACAQAKRPLDGYIALVTVES